MPEMTDAYQWQGRTMVGTDGEKIGKLQDVYVDVETDVPQFATVKEGFVSRHLTFVPLGGDGASIRVERRGDEVARITMRRFTAEYGFYRFNKPAEPVAGPARRSRSTAPGRRRPTSRQSSPAAQSYATRW